MSTLLLRFAAPMQSWGSRSKYETRYTDRAPTKSGVIGLLASALGWRRDCDLTPLSSGLRFGVRVDRPGNLEVDYHTAKGEKPYISKRHYLCDAIFLVGLEGDAPLLEKLDAALKAPAFPLFLGRRSCPPEGQLNLGIAYGKSLQQALEEHPLLYSPRYRSEDPIECRILMDVEKQDDIGYYQRDLPISFNLAGRKYDYRKVKEYHIKKNPEGIHFQTQSHDGSDDIEDSDNESSSHDAFAALESILPE